MTIRKVEQCCDFEKEEEEEEEKKKKKKKEEEDEEEERRKRRRRRSAKHRPPPFLKQRYENRQMLPKPTQCPVHDNRKSTRDRHVSRSSGFSSAP